MVENEQEHFDRPSLLVATVENEQECFDSVHFGCRGGK
uniref:Uncharacterized protein n=1 Tax=Nelumbo nucifera TaxID=4432 RepID=A0A822ZJ61_NELNU|nr:TPA_asm: hypothetical protein HUJ06_001659 [Nelumbo nucifera]